MNEYAVVLLVEQALSSDDAHQVWSLHEAMEEPVVYHLLLPLEDAAARIESALGSMSAGEMMASPALAMSDGDLEAVRRDCEDRSAAELRTSLDAFAEFGAHVQGQVVSGPVIDALADKVAEVDGREAIILTRPHVIAQLLHVDWASRARRKIGVPVLHLLEHESFDEQAGGGEGISGA